MTISLKDRLMGGIYGLLIGDAAGVPYEFKRPSSIPANAPLPDLSPPEGYKRTYPNVPVGTWSDDGSQALILLETLLESNGYVYDIFLNKLIAWKDAGYMAVDNFRFDIGNQTNHYLTLRQRINLGFDDRIPSNILSNQCGNGSLMRALPVALFFNTMDVENGADELHSLYTVSGLQSTVTHPQIIGHICCVLYNRMAERLLNGCDIIQSLDEAIKYVTVQYGTQYPDQLQIVLDYENNDINGSGYVVDSLWSAIYAFRTGSSYEDVIKRAIKLGDDTDTTACIAGGLAGIFYGYESIPTTFVGALRGKDLLEPLVQKLLVKRGVL